jgi:hypothetical protein
VGPIQPGLPAVGLPDGVGLDRYLDLVGPAVGVLTLAAVVIAAVVELVCQGTRRSERWRT